MDWKIDFLAKVIYKVVYVFILTRYVAYIRESHQD